MPKRQTFGHSVSGDDLQIEALSMRVFCDGGRYFCQAWDVIAYGADYQCWEGRGETEAEAIENFWAGIASVKKHRTQGTNDGD